MRTSQISSRALVSLLLVVGLGSCDFLTTEPKGQLTTESFFKTADQAREATNATYNMLRMWQVHVFSWIGLTDIASRSEEHTSELQSRAHLVCRLLLEKKNHNRTA